MKKIMLGLLISLLGTNILLSMERRVKDTPLLSIKDLQIIAQNALIDKELPIDPLEDADETIIGPLMFHVGSILDASKGLDDMIDSIAEDFKNYVKSPQKNLYIRIFRKLAKQKFTAEFNNGEVGDLKIIDLNNLSDSNTREMFIKTILSGANFNIAAAIIEPYRILDECNKRRGSGRTTSVMPLFTALARLNYAALVKLLIICGVDINNHHTYNTIFPYNYSALYFTAAAGNIQMATLLIQMGADVNFSIRGYHPALMGAVSKNKIEMCKFLIEMGADVNYQHLSGYTCLDTAKRKKFFDIQALLIQHGAKKEKELSILL